MSEKLYSCPHCGESWSVLEIREQECFECGYPNPVTDPEDALISVDIAPEYADTGRGLTPFVCNNFPNKYKKLHAERHYSSAFQHSRFTIDHSQ